MENKEVMDYTGLTTPTPGTADSKCAEDMQKEKEENLVAALLEAADFRNSEDLITPIEIRRGGKLLFSFRIRPVSDEEASFARKKARRMQDNPAGKKFPKIEAEFKAPVFNSRLIYIATVEEDRERIWGNKTILNRYDLMEAWESVGVLLTVGEKDRVVEEIMKISGMAGGQDEESEEEMEDLEDYAKN